MSADDDSLAKHLMMDCFQCKRSYLHEEYFRQYKELEIENTN